MRARASTRTMLAAGFAGFFALRAALALARSGPMLFADEAGYLGNARVLGGGIELVMGSSPFYRPGYSLLLVPLVGLGADPGTTYTLVLVLNAALAASLLPLLYVMLTRCFDVAPPAALAGAIAGAAYPTVTGISQVALSENVLFPLTVLWILSIAWVVRGGDRGAVLAGLASGASGAALWIVHGRMIVALVATAVTLLVLASTRRVALRAAAAGLVALGAGLVVGRLLNDFVIDRNWDGRNVDEIGAALGSLDHLGGLISVLRNAVGTSWYLLVATFGVIGLVLSRDRVTAAARSRWDVATVSTVLLLATAAGLIIVSAVWFVDVTRADQIVYGRYVEPVVPPLLALGIVGLVGRPPSRRTIAVVLAAIAGLTVTVAAVRAGLDFSGDDANRWSVASLPFFTGDLTPPVLIGAGVVASAGACVLFAAARWDARAMVVLLLAMFTLVAAFTELRLILRGDEVVYPSGWTSPEESVGTGEGTVAFDTAEFDRIAVKVYQWFLPHRHLEEFDSTLERPPVPLFFSGRRQPPGDPRAAAIWRDPGRPQVLRRGGSSR